MHSPSTPPSDLWLRLCPSATLGERSEALRQRLLDEPTWLCEHSDEARAERRLRLWRRPPFDRDGVLERRLKLDGLDLPTFRALLGLPNSALAELVSPPAWVETLRQAYLEAPEPEAQNYRARWPRDGQAPSYAFLRLLQPLIDPRLRQLTSTLGALQASGPVPWGEPEASVDSLLDGALQSFEPRLLGLLQRTLTLELHVAGLEEILEGETPEARFASFVDQLARPPFALELLCRYPLLARRSVAVIAAWSGELERLLRRLHADAAELWSLLLPSGRTDDAKALPQLEAIGPAAGDPHRGGAAVRRLRFVGGFELMYKPRPLTVERRFQDLLDFVGRRDADSLQPGLRLPRLLDRGHYGWVQVVRREPCADAAAIERFYRRQGMFLALLYALDGVDLHYENLIACGEHPMLVDLEALFHARLDIEDTGARGVAGRRLTRSVLRVGLLPMTQGGDRGATGIGADASALSAPAKAKTSVSVAVAEGAGTDRMRFVRRQLERESGDHLPLEPGGEPVAVHRHAEPLIEGFRDTYRWLLRHVDDLLAEDGAVSAFEGAEVRLILRPTRVYQVLRFESSHPEVLGDALDRDRLFDRLWLDTDRRPHLETLIPSEQAALRRDDVPAFTSRPESRDLWGDPLRDETQRHAEVEARDAAAVEPIRDYLAESGLDLVRARLRSLSEEDLEQQLWLVRASLATLEGATEGVRVPRERVSAAAAAPMPPAEAFLDLAAAVGRRLASLAVHGEDGVTWVGVQRAPGGGTVLDALRPDLHHGLAGVTLFLVHLARHLRAADRHLDEAERFEHLAAQAWTQAESLLAVYEDDPASLPECGAFLGWGGLIYAAMHLAEAWQRPALVERAIGWVDCLRRNLDDDRELDLVSGAAGAVLVLLRLAEHPLVTAPRAGAVRAAAVACGEHLLEQASSHPSLPGSCWPNRAAAGEAGEHRPLTGLSHGTAGIAWALAELAVVTGEARFRDAALAGLTYEQATFERANADGDFRFGWPDLRYYAPDGRRLPGVEVPDIFPAWCHGGAGIALSRLRLLELERKEPGKSPPRNGWNRQLLERELHTSARVLVEQGFGRSHCLCHGDLGNLDVLAQLARAGYASAAEVDRLGAAIVREIQRHGWLCGMAQGAESPSLMAGLSGIGYGLLRVAFPERVPSVLALEPARY